MLLVFLEARTKNSDTSVPSSMAKENPSNPTDLLHILLSEKQYCKKVPLWFGIRLTGVQVFRSDSTIH